MRIAVVQHVRAGNFSDYISVLLDEAALKFNYQVKTWSNSIPAFKQQISNDAVVYILNESTGAFALRWWYKVKLRSILKKLKPDVVLDMNGISTDTAFIQFAVFDQLLLNKDAGLLNIINKLAQQNLNKTIHTCAHIITYAQQKTNTLFKEATNKLQVIYFTAPANFRKFEWHEKIMIKAMHADNNEYFISVLNDDAEEDFTTLLRGFSEFKKWQQSNMKLILLPKYETFDAVIHEKLKKYKYRTDVNLVETPDETALVSLFASAHSLIHFASGIADLLTLAIALKCALPVITFKDEEVEEYMGEAAYYMEDKSSASLGKTLIKMYKDENLQAQLKEAAEKQSLLFKREDYTSKLWQLITTAAHYQA